MTFTQFIKELSSEQVNTWWQTYSPNQAPNKVEEENRKYKLKKNGKVLPFKWSIAELAKHHNIPFSNKDFDSNVANRDAFCEAFDFEIQEDLVYDDNENKGFQDFYSKKVSNKQLFQSFIEYGNNLVKDCNINPYKIRMAISSDKKNAMIILGMRAVLQYSENNGNPIIGFILQKEFVDRLEDKILESIYPFKGNDTSKVFATVSTKNWNDLPKKIIENNLLSVKEQYGLINNSKRATWNTEANTTNSVLKYLIFKNKNAESWIENNKPINYWVFQGNPKEFDIVKALEDNALKTWRVKAHKDKINKGDKVILWAGGKNSGVYALATVDSEVTIMPEPEIEKQYYKDQTVYHDKERVFLKIDYNLFNQPVLKSELEKYTWFSKMKVGSQGTNFTATKEEYESIKMLISKMNKLIINISWNSKDWKEESQDKSNHEWVKKGGIPFESWNFADDAEGNTEEYIFGYAKFTNNPKISGKSIFIFYSDKKIVGFYGNAAIVDKKVKDNVLNLRGDQNISFVLENKIENIVEKGYLEDGKRIGQGGFNYLHKNETVLKIIDEALQLNPNQKEQILRLKEWFMKETQSNQSKENLNKSSNVPLNQILYGPPGTGKTHKLKNEYFSKYTLTENSISPEAYFEDVVTALTWWQVIALALVEIGTNKVNEILENKWVAKKAQLSESKNVRATIWGTLQMHTIVDSKTVNYTQRQTPFIFDKTEDKKWQLFENDLKEQAPEIYDILDSVNNFKPNPNKEIKHYVFTTFHQSFSYEDFIEGIKPVMEEGQENVTYKIENGIFKELCLRAQNDPINRYAIFIDEINRGNVSQIFGELITLIEHDKRIGAPNEIRVKLPYSKKEFGVPMNIDIIGTMNTADRSVEALDTALRRRFSFEEMLPSYDIKELDYFISDYKASEILKTINTRIELLLGREYVIGHSYFLDKTTSELNEIKDSINALKILLDSVNSKREKDEIKIELTKLNNLLSEKETNRKRYDEINLLESFYKNIIPLLQEYFYNDFGKIGLVLGKGFVRAKSFENKSKSIFADFELRNEVDLIKTYEVIPKNEIKFNEAINLMMV